MTLARSLPEARAAFHRIKGRTNQYGEQNEAVLVQEFMAGTEYVVNCVSQGGKHKVVSIWRYDKVRAGRAGGLLCLSVCVHVGGVRTLQSF